MSDREIDALSEMLRRQTLLSQPPSSDALPRQEQFGAGAGARYPALHEQQIDRYAAMSQVRKERLEAHAHRVDAELRTNRRDESDSQWQRRGKPRAVRCVEREQVFRSVASAARFVQRSPSNIIQSIQFGYRCGDYHWSYAELDPAASPMTQDRPFK